MAEVVKLNIRPVPVNPVVDKASDTIYTFEIHDATGGCVDLRGYTAKMMLRPFHSSKRAYDELTTENGRLEIRGGTVSVHFPADVTVTYKFTRAVYDLLIISMDGLQYRVAEGEVYFRPEVTR
jgi:hypothetical protein